MDLAEITPVILTLNEAPNIRRSLTKLTWAKDIVVVDSFSTDETLQIAKGFPQVRVFQRRFDFHASQANYSISETGIKTEWILTLDADYVLTDEFIHELKELDPTPETVGYEAPFIYCLLGKRLRGTLYPRRVVLFRQGKGKYIQDGHAHRLVSRGCVARMKSFILHDDRKSFSRWFRAQQRYAHLEADKIHSASFYDLSWPDRIRKLIGAAPLAVFSYCLFVKGLILDGVPGIYYSFQRLLAECLLSVQLLRRLWHLKRRQSNPS